MVGGSSAIGAAIATELAGLGREVVLWGRDRDRLETAATTVEAAGARARVAVVDVRQRDKLDSAAEAVRDGLDVVVWAAGVFDWADGDVAEPAALEELFDVNLVAAARLSRLLLPTLIRNAPGALVFVGSGAARQAYPHNAAYVASKHGLRGLAEALWLDVRDRGVKVSTVSPGLVAAGAGLASPEAARRPDLLLQPADVAAAVRFVCTFPERACPTEIRLESHRA